MLKTDEKKGKTNHKRRHPDRSPLIQKIFDALHNAEVQIENVYGLLERFESRAKKDKDEAYARGLKKGRMQAIPPSYKNARSWFIIANRLLKDLTGESFDDLTTVVEARYGTKKVIFTAPKGVLVVQAAQRATILLQRKGIMPKTKWPLTVPISYVNGEGEPVAGFAEEMKLQDISFLNMTGKAERSRVILIIPTKTEQASVPTENGKEA